LALLSRMFASLEGTAREVDKLVIAARTGEANIPALLKRLDTILANVQVVTRDLARATPRVTGIARNVERSTDNLPALLTQTQQAALELEALLVQLRGHWLLGGNPTEPAPRRLAPSEVRP